MLGFTAALGAELATGQSVFTQFNEAAAPIIATAVIFTIASLVPMLKGSNKEAFGPFTPQVRKPGFTFPANRDIFLFSMCFNVQSSCGSRACRRRPPTAALP